jgi:putative flippase GtrA
MTFPRFVIAGTLNTGLTYLLYLGLLLLIPYVWAYSLTYVFGIFFGYIVNTKWVFNKAPSLRTAVTFPLTYGINYLLGVGLLWLLVELLRVPKEVAPLIVVIASVPIMYVLSRSIFLRKLRNETKNDNK